MRDGVDGPLGSEGVIDAEGEEITPAVIVDMKLAVDVQNAELINKLSLVGRAPNPIVMMENKLAVLIDFMFNDEADARQAFETAVSIRFNQQLREVLEEVTSQLTLG